LQSGTCEGGVQVEDGAAGEVGLASVLSEEGYVAEVQSVGALCGAGDPGGVELDTDGRSSCADGCEQGNVAETGTEVDEGVGFGDGC